MTKPTTLVAILAIGCAGKHGAHDQPDASSDASSDGSAAVGDGLSRCDTSTAPRALLVAISAVDTVQLFSLGAGMLTDTGVKITGIDKPAQIVMRDDGAEALVIYGGWGTPFGVAAIALALDGSSAQLEQTLLIGTDSTPISITYVDRDHAVIALTAANDEVVGITRGSSGWVAGPRVPAPAEYPLAVRARPGTSDVLFSRSEVGVDPTLDIYRLRETPSATWQSAGSHASVGPTPIAMALHASGRALYVPTSDPTNQPSPANLDAPGQLHAVQISDDGFALAGVVELPRIASLIAADPQGRFTVSEGNVYTLDDHGDPDVVAYTWQTVRTNADGSLGDAAPESQPAAGLLFDDLAIDATGHLVAAREMEEGTVPASQQYPLELWAQPVWGGWQLCATAYLAGGAHVAIAP
ncbi:MAG TPA: hypothetical protein VMJ10_29135 [Kofleriaceae bacterium]|nr:hypothetical protein [Kofleriaceae bacterium]